MIKNKRKGREKFSEITIAVLYAWSILGEPKRTREAQRFQENLDYQEL